MDPRVELMCSNGSVTNGELLRQVGALCLVNTSLTNLLAATCAVAPLTTHTLIYLEKLSTKPTLI